jgi:hypothetical protein
MDAVRASVQWRKAVVTDPVPYTQLVEDVTYRVRFDDCCVAGAFTSKLVEITRDDEDDGWPTRLRFENRVVLDTFHGVRFTPKKGSQQMTGPVKIGGDIDSDAEEQLERDQQVGDERRSGGGK